MSIMSKIKGDNDNSDTASVLERIRAHEARAGQLNAKLTTLGADRVNAERERSAAALLVETGNAPESAFLAADKEVTRLQREQERAQFAQRANSQALLDARAELDKLGKAGLLKQVRRLCTQRAKIADELGGALETYAKSYDRICNVTEKLAGVIGNRSIGGGALMRPSELIAAIEKEMQRVAPYHPLEKGTRHLPGSKVNLMANPTGYTPFTEAVKVANEHLIERVENGPTTQTNALTITPEEPANEVTDGTRLVRTPVTLDMGGDK